MVNGAIRQRYLRIAQVAEYTGLSVSTIRARILSKQIPYIKREGCVLFDINQVDAWMEGAQVTKVVSEKENIYNGYTINA